MSNIIRLKLKQPESYQEFITYASFETEPIEANRAIAVNLSVIQQELDNLFSTKMYERPYLPDYYNPIEELIGELWTDEVSSTAIHLITDKVSKYIPHITINENTSFSYSNYKLYMELIFSFNNDFTRTLYNYKREFNAVT